MKRQVRFLRDNRWTRWYGVDEDLSFLKNNCVITAIETTEEMTREEFAKSHPEIAARI